MHKHRCVPTAFHPTDSSPGQTDAIDNFGFSYWSLRSLVGAPSLKTWIGLLPFFMSSGVQHDAHAYLASLEKYSLPRHPLFHRLVCPHYLAECVIYASLMVLAAPKGLMLNSTIWCALLFVACNLGVSAGHTRRWYEMKFGKETIATRWNMIVGLY